MKKRYNIILSILLLIIFMLDILFTRHFNILLIILTTIIINILIFMLINRKDLVTKVRENISDVLFTSLILVPIFPVDANFVSIVLTSLFVFSIYYLFFNYSDRRIIIHPTLIGLMFLKLSYPEKILENLYDKFDLFSIQENINPNLLLVQNGNMIIYQLIIGFLIVAIISVIFRRINIVNSLIFYICFIFLEVFILKNSINIIFDGFIVFGALFILSNSETSPKYFLTSILSGLFAAVIGFLLSIKLGLLVSLTIAFTIIGFVNPYIDLLLLKYKKLKPFV